MAGTSRSRRRPRLVATDLDGTLLRSDGTISPRTSAALAALEAAGIGMVFVTARPPRWLRHARRAVGPRGRRSAPTGLRLRGRHAQVPADELLERALAGRDRRRPAASRARGIGFSAERATGCTPGRTTPSCTATGARRPVPARARRPAEPRRQVLAPAPDLPDDEFIPRVAEVVGDRALVQLSGAGGLAEISAPGVTKAAGLVRWATGSASRRPTSGPSATCPTTCPCSPGRESAGPWPTRHPTRAPRRRPDARPTTTTGSRTLEAVSLKRFDRGR